MRPLALAWTSNPLIPEETYPRAVRARELVDLTMADPGCLPDWWLEMFGKFCGGEDRKSRALRC